MIIQRYLAKEVLQSTFAVTFVLLIIIMCGRFIKYLAQAAAGKVDASILLEVMAYRLPGFLELILPLGFFIALLLAYGRLYAEHEMTVLSACGMSRSQLLLYSFLPATLIAIIIAALSLWISPYSLQKAHSLLNAQEAKSDVDTLKPARFQSMRNGTMTTYTKDINGDELSSIFIATQNIEGQLPSVITAKTGRFVFNETYGQRYLLLRDGARYEGIPGTADYRVTFFEQYAQHIAEPEFQDQGYKQVDAQSTAELMQQDSLAASATLQWRFSLPLLIVIVTLVGVPLSYTSPRKGRYTKLFPAIILYLLYVVGLNSARGSIEKGKLPVELGLWWVHAVVILIALFLLALPSWRRRLYKG